jgi:uncharacterized protein YndB with AHSA1/START domain
MTGETAPLVVRAQMLIRRPAGDVFNAFIDPVVTTQFWFTRGSGELRTGAEVTWEWEMYGASAKVRVKEVEQDRRILIEWDDPPTLVEWRFDARPDGTTLVTIENRGFTGTAGDVTARALDSMGGFSLVLAGLKAYLEHGVHLNLVADHQPDAHVAGGGEYPSDRVVAHG